MPPYLYQHMNQSSIFPKILNTLIVIKPICPPVHLSVYLNQTLDDKIFRSQNSTGKSNFYITQNGVCVINNCNKLFYCRTIQDPRSQRLTWYKPPLSVLVIKKIFDAAIIKPYVELVTWLVEVSGHVITE